MIGLKQAKGENMIDLNESGNFIAAIRKEKGLTQTKLAEKIQVSENGNAARVFLMWLQSFRCVKLWISQAMNF